MKIFIFALIGLSTSSSVAALTNSKTEVRTSVADVQPVDHLKFFLSPLGYQMDMITFEGQPSSETSSRPMGLGLAWNEHLFFVDQIRSDLTSGNATLSVRHRHQEIVLTYMYEYYRPQKWFALNAGIGAGFTEDFLDTQLQSLQDSSRTGRQNLFQANVGVMGYWRFLYLGWDLKMQSSRDQTPNPQLSWAVRTGLQLTIF